MSKRPWQPAISRRREVPIAAEKDHMRANGAEAKRLQEGLAPFNCHAEDAAA